MKPRKIIKVIFGKSFIGYTKRIRYNVPHVGRRYSFYRLGVSLGYCFKFRVFFDKPLNSFWKLAVRFGPLIIFLQKHVNEVLIKREEADALRNKGIKYINES